MQKPEPERLCLSPTPTVNSQGDESAKVRFNNAMSQMKNMFPIPELQASTVPFRPYSCDSDGDSDKVLAFRPDSFRPYSCLRGIF